ncbi:hypothetical protein Ddye_026186 [Dipteronia dyeriana]|uniref:Reverse transcriptase n=1 Tax=Dipteronia dyeriana TaxID=168575 RepID=A0AAD9TM91_9ROSI|nr:hypothetical protein Ddye_026186 [Dipteronia dyeriana]
MALKIDMSKAYDRVEWGFAEKIMVNLREKWRKLIMNCIGSVSYSFRLNGEGEPVMGSISGFKHSRYGPTISHHFIMDDILLLSRAAFKNYEAIKMVLLNYSEASSQIVNFNKSTICISPSVGIIERKKLVALIGVKLVDCHERYLELPCFSKRSKRKLFANIIDRVCSRIKGWGGGEKLLSVGGKEILIKAVVQAIPSYAMSIFWLPKNLFDKIERLAARYWWGGNENSRKIHWCRWQQLCKPKSEGGLGFRDLETFNRSLLAKQCWQNFRNPNSLSTNVLKGCYFEKENFLEVANSKRGLYVWNSSIRGRAILDKVDIGLAEICAMRTANLAHTLWLTGGTGCGCSTYPQRSNSSFGRLAMIGFQQKRTFV